MAITFLGTAGSNAGTSGATSIDVTHTADSGTELLLLATGWRVNAGQTLSSIEDWVSSSEAFTEIYTSNPINVSDITMVLHGIVSPTAKTETLTITYSASTSLQWVWLANFAGNDTANVAAATNVLEEVDNTVAAATTAFASAGTAGNGLVVVGAGIGEDMTPASVDASFVEIIDDDTGGTAPGDADHGFYMAYLLDAAPAGPTITWGATDENAGALIELVAAGGAATTPKGPLGMPLVGAFGGPI